MKKKCLTLLLSVALMATSIGGTGLSVYGADLAAEKLTEAGDTGLFDGTSDAMEANLLTEGRTQIADATKKSQNSITGITLTRKVGYDVLDFFGKNSAEVNVKITYADGTKVVKRLLSGEKYEDKYGNRYYCAVGQKRVAGAKERTYIFRYYVTNAGGAKKTFTDKIQVKDIAGMTHVEVNKKYQIKKDKSYIFIPSKTAEYAINYTKDSNMWFWELNSWKDGSYSISFVDREKNDYGSYKVVKSKLEKGKQYIITSVEDNNFYVSNVVKEKKHSWDNGKITRKATCTKDGIKTYTCKTCKKTQTKSIPKTGHKKITKYVKKATCKANGYTGDVYCKNCGKLLKKGKSIKKLSHKWGQWKKISNATASKKAKQQRVCTVCKSVQTREY